MIGRGFFGLCAAFAARNRKWRRAQPGEPSGPPAHFNFANSANSGLFVPLSGE